jgi:hypothetical protein
MYGEYISQSLFIVNIFLKILFYYIYDSQFVFIKHSD